MRAEPAGLVSAPTAPELAGLLYRLLDTRQPAQPPRTGQARDGGAHQWPASQPPDAGRDPARWMPPGSASTSLRRSRGGRAVPVLAAGAA